MRREKERPTDTTLIEGAELGVLLGSGLDAVTEGLAVESVLRYDRIEGLDAPAVPGHRGELRRCVISARACLFICGRRHFYEGGVAQLGTLLRLLHRAGLRRLVVTSAAGSLVKSIFPGELVMVSDLADVQHRPRPRVGPDLADIGRPAGARLGLDPAMSRDLWVAASRAGVGLGRGSAISCAGPAYETPSEVRALQESGASVVTMSGAPELEIASALGVSAAMIAVVTNWAAGISTIRLRHADVLESARAAAGRLRRLVVEFVEADPS